MYRSINGPLRGCPELDELGFSFKPPKWLRNLAARSSDVATQGKAAVDSVNANYPAPAPAGFSMDAMPSWLLPVGIGLVAFMLLGKGRR